MNKGMDIRLRKSVEMANIKPEDKILDLGCGMQILRDYLPPECDNKYVGLDKRYEDGDDLEKGLPPEIKSMKFDVIFMNEFIEHIENFKSLLMECKDILSKNGRIIISTPAANRIVYGDLFDGIGENNAHIHTFKKSNMRNLARICGYKITGIRGTYIRFPPLLKHSLLIPTNQTVYSEVLIYRLEVLK